ncbi:hypothetical protein MBLNU230_g7286t1 [Neophaeotheca triangularis]
MWTSSLALPVAVILLLTIFTSPLAAQQHEGEQIPNSLPPIGGAELTYFRIKNPRYDPSNHATGEEFYTATNYANLRSDGRRHDPSDIRRAVIVVHGKHRDPETYETNMLHGLSKVSENDGQDISTDNVAVVSPLFANGHDRRRAYPWKHRKSLSSALVWTATQWSAGADTHWPRNSSISSYEVLDQMVAYFDNSTLFPNLQQIVVSGHSLGAQAVQRYAALTTQNTTRPVSYWVANPNSYIWFSDTRPLPIADCPEYNDYRAGYANFESYPMTYGSHLVSQGVEAIYANYQSKAIAYGRAIRDFGDKSSSCAATTSGKNRGERFHNFIAAFPPSCSNSTDPSLPHDDTFPPHDCDTIDLVNTGHNSAYMMASGAGRQRLFLDNWEGDGSRAFDIGYPRVVPAGGDDPFPDPSKRAEAEELGRKAREQGAKVQIGPSREKGVMGGWWEWIIEILRGT